MFMSPWKIVWKDRLIAHLHARGDGTFLDENDSVVELKGVNWFGFNDNYRDPNDHDKISGMLTAMEGPENATALTTDFKVVAQRMKLLGFNAIRLPFSFQILWADNFKPWNYGTRPVSWRDILQSVMPNDQFERYRNNGQLMHILDHFPESYKVHDFDSIQSISDVATNVTQNADLPQDSIENRFIYVVRYLIDSGFYVVLENHLSHPYKDSQGQWHLGDSDNTIMTQSKEDWARRWADLVYNINFKGGATNPATGNPLPVMGHGRKYEDYLIADLLNEPDAMQHEGWAGKPGRQHFGEHPTWGSLQEHYFAAMDMIHEASPRTMFFLEGCDAGHSSNWGDDFEDDNLSFFTSLRTKMYKDLVVLSPHVYPPSIADSANQNQPLPHDSRFQPPTCRDRWTKSFGARCLLNSNGAHLWPLCFGETGSRQLADDGTHEREHSDSRDDAFMETFKHYLTENNFRNLLWWSWANSPDSGAITLDDNEDNGNNIFGHQDKGKYTKINFRKIEWMMDAVGLKPWYKT